MKKFFFITTAFVLWSAISANAQWQLVWSDEFNYTGLPDADKWSFEDWAPGMVNHELQRYTPNRSENCRVEDGKLIIEARRDWYNGSEYSSARINSSKKGFWTYGRMEARVKLPGGKGTWPAFWMMPEDITKYGWNSETNYWWPNSGEIDILEEVGCDAGWINASVHSAKYYFKKGNQKTGKVYYSDAESAFHVYAVEWAADKMDFFVDNNKYFTVYNDGTGWEAYPFNHDFHIIFNLAVGGDWGGYKGVDPNIWPRKMEVDYVRVYKPSVSCTTFEIPGKIEAEMYCQMQGIQTENCSEGTKNVGWIDNGDWMSYNIKVTTAGSYKVSYRVASPNNGTKLQLNKVADATILGTINIPNTGGWQNWTTISNTVTMPAGNYSINIKALASGFNINWLDIQPASQQSFYTKIEAEKFNSMHGVQTENCSEGGQNVGWIDATDWMSYDVNLPYTGVYTVKYRVSSPNTTGSLILSKNATDLTINNIPKTGGWQNWTTLSLNVTLSAGQQALALYAKTGGFNVNWWSIEWGANGLKSASNSDDATEGIQDNNNPIIVYPNPVSDKLYISAKNHDIIRVSIFDINGKLVVSSEIKSSEAIDVTKMRSGIYILKATNASSTRIQKIFIK